MIRVLHIEPLRYGPEARRLLASVAEVDYREVAGERDLLKMLSSSEYEAVFLRLGLYFGEEMMQACPRLRYLVTPTTGLNHIDLVAAARRGIQVLSLQGETAFLESIRSTSEHTMALLLSLVRRVPAASRSVESGRWEREPFLGRELSGRRLGIIGYGRLGRLVARYAQAFYLQVLVYDRREEVFSHLPKGVERVSLEVLLRRSDFVSLHIPGTVENAAFMDARKFAQMRKGAFFINTSRGEVVDEEALLSALKSGHLAGAALDVLVGDSRWEGRVPERHPLVAFAKSNPQLILTPHIGGYARESLDATRLFMVNKFIQALSSFSEPSTSKFK